MKFVCLIILFSNSFSVGMTSGKYSCLLFFPLASSPVIRSSQNPCRAYVLQFTRDGSGFPTLQTEHESAGRTRLSTHSSVQRTRRTTRETRLTGNFFKVVSRSIKREGCWMEVNFLFVAKTGRMVDQSTFST